MSAEILHPSQFIESDTCQLQNVRIQPSRETPGVLLSEKYIIEYEDNGLPIKSVDFNLPFRNALRSIKQLKMAYEKMTPEQIHEANKNLFTIEKVSNFIISPDVTIIEQKENFAEFGNSENIEPELKSLNTEETSKRMNTGYIFFIIFVFIAIFFIGFGVGKIKEF